MYESGFNQWQAGFIAETAFLGFWLVFGVHLAAFLLGWLLMVFERKGEK